MLLLAYYPSMILNLKLLKNPPSPHSGGGRVLRAFGGIKPEPVGARTPKTSLATNELLKSYF